jgi:hypothetical protein
MWRRLSRTECRKSQTLPQAPCQGSEAKHRGTRLPEARGHRQRGGHNQRESPLIYHWQEFRKNENIRQGFAATATVCPPTVASSRPIRIKDMAINVVGVLSVGTFCAILLLMAAEDGHFLDIKKQTRWSSRPLPERAFTRTTGRESYEAAC